MKTTYNEVEITYDESTNRWLFTLRGRDRSAESLAKAKEFIDKPLPAEKAKPFEKIPAWIAGHGSEPAQVTITGIAERGYGSGPHVWIVNEHKERSKESVPFKLYPQNEKNDAICAKITANLKEAERLRNEANELRRTLQPLVIPKDE